MPVSDRPLSAPRVARRRRWLRTPGFDPDAFPGLPTHGQASAELIRLGVPRQRVDRMTPVETRHLLATLDTLFNKTSSRAALRSFLLANCPQLGGERPVDLLGEPDGVDSVRAAVLDRVYARS